MISIIYSKDCRRIEREKVRIWMKSDDKKERPFPLMFESLRKFGTIQKSHEFEKKNKDKDVEGDCVICLDSLTREEGIEKQIENPSQFIFQLKSCSHAFHVPCAKSIIDQNKTDAFFICPICKSASGNRVGNQPDGQMNITKQLSKLPGFESTSTGTIVVTYFFSNGIQGSNHPNPGIPYSAASFPRTAYFPDNEEGKKVIYLMKIAFDRKLIFTIGRSVTSGQDNVITWNGIHHKTSISGSSYGYPDATYLERVISELRAFGVGLPRVWFTIKVNDTIIGKIVMELRSDVVPKTAEYFRELCTGEKGYGLSKSRLYNTNKHYIQGGDIVEKNGACGKSIHTVDFEYENFYRSPYGPGSLVMANSLPNTNQSQFFIITSSHPSFALRWEEKCTIFGSIIQGMEVVELIQKTELFSANASSETNEIIIHECGESPTNS